jgi:hydrogenase expression/formation protein HypE
MKLLLEGKISLEILMNLTKSQGYLNNTGIVQPAAPGVDIAALDLQAVKDQIQSHYHTSSTPYLIYKSDPITFPTPDPAMYLVIVNVNDLATCGAIPYGMTITILLPPESTKKSVIEFQSRLSDVCKDYKITILGGHTEVTDTVNSPIYSASMIGFVPPEYYIPRDPKPGDVIICSGWVGAEGTGILISHDREYFSSKLSPAEVKHGLTIGKQLDISKSIYAINSKWHSSINLVHDATEGGIFGAIYECLAPLGLGCRIEASKIPLATITKDITKILEINPFKLISSGAVLIICREDEARDICDFLNENNKGPSSIIGHVTEKGTPLLVDSNKIPSPEADELIKGIDKLNSHTA